MAKFQLEFYRTYGQYAYEVVDAASEEEAREIASAIAHEDGPALNSGTITTVNGEKVREDDLMWDDEGDGGTIEGPRLSGVRKV